MIEQIKAMSLAKLRDRWRDADEDKFIREEALWEYWRRVADGSVPFSMDDIDELLSLDNARIVDVLGLLARRDLLTDESFQAAQRFQGALEDDVWLAAQLGARDMIRRLKAGDEPFRNELCDALVAKGTAWAALEAVSLLHQEQLETLLAVSEKRRVFTKGQRHDLRVLASASAVE